MRTQRGRWLDSDPVVVVPLPRAGRHRRPASGACLMELVSAVTGQVWNDHPPAVHPTLGVLARHVNDLLSTDQQRRRLLALVPHLLDTASADAGMTGAVALPVLHAAAAVSSADRPRRALVGLDAASSLLAAPTRAPRRTVARHTLRVHRAMRQAVRALVAGSAEPRRTDDMLVDLLRESSCRSKPAWRPRCRRIGERSARAIGGRAAPRADRLAARRTAGDALHVR